MLSFFHIEGALFRLRLFYPENTSGRFAHKYMYSDTISNKANHLRRVKLKCWRHSKRLWCAQVANHNDSWLHEFTHNNCVRCIYLCESILMRSIGNSRHSIPSIRLHRKRGRKLDSVGSFCANLFEISHFSRHTEVALSLLKHIPESTTKKLNTTNLISKRRFHLFVLLISFPCCFNIFLGKYLNKAFNGIFVYVLALFTSLKSKRSFFFPCIYFPFKRQEWWHSMSDRCFTLPFVYRLVHLARFHDLYAKNAQSLQPSIDTMFVRFIFFYQ